MTDTKTNPDPPRRDTQRQLLRPGTHLSALLVNGLACAALGCSSEAVAEPGSFGETPAAIAKSEKGQFEIALYSSPTSVPVRGENHVRLSVVEFGEDELPLTPSLVTFMPAMGHGSGVTPTLTEVEEQTYTFESVVFNMPGRWELRLALDSESDDGPTTVDNAVFEFDVD
jgi:YtkA-like